jgi:hypothetical protein
VLVNNSKPPAGKIDNPKPPAGMVEDLRVAAQVLRKMEEENFDLASEKEYDAVIIGLAAHHVVDEALELADRAFYSDATPSLVTLIAVVAGCAHGADLRVASDTFKLMKHAGMTPDACAYEALLRCSMAAADTRFSFRAWRQMLIEGQVGENVLALCADLFASFGKGGLAAASYVQKLFDTLEPNFITPDDTTYATGVQPLSIPFGCWPITGLVLAGTLRQSTPRNYAETWDSLHACS